MASLSLWICIAALPSFSVLQSLTCQALLSEIMTLHCGGWSPKLNVEISVVVSMTQNFLHSVVYITLHDNVRLTTTSMTYSCSLFTPSYFISGRWAVYSRTLVSNKDLKQVYTFVPLCMQVLKSPMNLFYCIAWYT